LKERNWGPDEMSGDADTGAMLNLAQVRLNVQIVGVPCRCYTQATGKLDLLACMFALLSNPYPIAGNAEILVIARLSVQIGAGMLYASINQAIGGWWRLWSKGINGSETMQTS